MTFYVFWNDVSKSRKSHKKVLAHC